ncbi:MAG: pilin [Halioglobus sp.]
MTRQQSRNKGFTLIELMGVIAIVSILAVLSISAYSNFTVRAKVGEGLSFADEAKTAVTEAYYTTNTFPVNNTEAGLASSTSYDHLDYISSLAIGADPTPGTITITIKVATLGADNLLQFVPSTVDEQLVWTCKPAASNGVASIRLPANCRG